MFKVIETEIRTYEDEESDLPFVTRDREDIAEGDDLKVVLAKTLAHMKKGGYDSICDYGVVDGERFFFTAQMTGVVIEHEIQADEMLTKKQVKIIEDWLASIG